MPDTESGSWIDRRTWAGRGGPKARMIITVLYIAFVELYNIQFVITQALIGTTSS